MCVVALPSTGFDDEKRRSTLAIRTQRLAFYDEDRGNGVGESVSILFLSFPYFHELNKAHNISLHDE